MVKKVVQSKHKMVVWRLFCLAMFAIKKKTKYEAKFDTIILTFWFYGKWSTLAAVKYKPFPVATLKSVPMF